MSPKRFTAKSSPKADVKNRPQRRGARIQKYTAHSGDGYFSAAAVMEEMIYSPVTRSSEGLIKRKQRTYFSEEQVPVSVDLEQFAKTIISDKRRWVLEALWGLLKIHQHYNSYGLYDKWDSIKEAYRIRYTLNFTSFEITDLTIQQIIALINHLKDLSSGHVQSAAGLKIAYRNPRKRYRIGFHIAVPDTTLLDDEGRPVFTGRHLVSLDEESEIEQLVQMALEANLIIKSIDDFHVGGERAKVSEVLETVDGVILPLLRIVIFNGGLESKLSVLLGSNDLKNHFHYEEPSRYVYQEDERTWNFPLSDSPDATWGIRATNILDAKETGKNIRIAILDTGINFLHGDFMNRKGEIKTGSFVKKEDVHDTRGHGTFCAGIISGHLCSNSGMRYGVARDVQLYCGKVVDKRGRGDDDQLIDGIEWALRNQCNIINVSLSRPPLKRNSVGYVPIYEDLARKSLRNNCIIIAAVGNNCDRKNDVFKPVGIPANCPSVMGVAAIDQYFKVANFSRSQLHGPLGSVNIAAPGVRIISTCIENMAYKAKCGTSFAAPYVSGLAALYWERFKTFDAKQIWTKLTETAEKLSDPEEDVGIGLVFFR